MDSPPPPAEQARLLALRRYAVLDTPPEDAFDRIVRLTADLFGAPIALIALLDERRQWFKAALGLDAQQTDRSIAFCAHTILTDQPLVIPDASIDERFADNPLVTEAPHVRFYAGAPLVSPEGARIGTLAVLDTVPRTLDPRGAEQLATLAEMVIEALEARLARERLNVLAANAPVILFILDREGRFMFTEGSGLASLPLRPNELIGRTVFEVYGDAPLVVENVRRALAGETVFRTVHVGSEVYDTRYVPMLDASGEVSRVIGVATNVSERARTEEALRASEARLTTIIETMTEGIAILDRDGRYVMINAAATEIAGVPREQIIGRRFGEAPWQIVRPDSSPLTDEQYTFNRVRHTGRPASTGEVILVRPDGSRRVISTTAAPLRDEDGAFAGTVSVISDITEAAATARALRESREQLAHVIDTITEGITIVDAEGRFTLVNAAAERLLGVPRDRLLGSSIVEPIWERRTLDGAPLPLEAHPFTVVQRTQRPVHGAEYVIVRPDDTSFILSVNAAPLTDDAGNFTGMVSSLTDVTDRKQAEQLRAELLAREQESRAQAEAAAQRLRDLQSILDATLAQAGNADAVLQVLAERVAQALGLTATSVRLFDETDGMLHIRAGYNMPREEWEERALTPGQGGAGRAYAEGRPVYIRDMQDVPWTPSEYIRRAGIRSLLAVPMRIGDRIIGVLNTLCGEIREFTPDEIRLVEVAADRGAAVAEQARLYAAEREARQKAQAGEQRLTFLTEASAVLASSLDYEDTLERLARLAVPFLADWCLVDIAEPEGGIRRITGRHASPAKDVLLQHLARRFPPRLDQRRGVAAVIRTGVSSINAEITDELLAEWSQNDEHFALLREIGARSQMCVPLTVRGRTLGALSFLTSRPDRAYTPADLALAEELARRAAVAVDQARVHRAESQARAAAETSARRLRFLTEASAALAESLEPDATYNTLARVVVPAMADRCTIYAVEADGSLRWAASAAVDEAAIPLMERLHRSYASNMLRLGPLVEALQSGHAVILPVSSVERMAAAAENEEHRRLLRALPIHSWMIAPVMARGRMLGAISFVYASAERAYGPEDLDLAEELCRRAAVAVENAQLYEAEQRARRAAEQAAARTARLQEITAALSEAMTPATVTNLIVQHAVAAMNASGGSVFLRSPDGTALTLVSALGYPPELEERWRRLPIDAPLAPTEAARTGEMITITSREERARRYPPRDRAMETGSEAFAVIPLAVEGRVLGVLHLGFLATRGFDAEDQAFMRALGQQCAQALERARLQQEATAAAAALETERFKTDLLNTVSHELRTPLAAIKGFSSAMLMFGKRMPRGEQTAFLQEIDGAADRLTELVDNLLDLARLESGSLPITLAPLNLSETLRAAVEDARAHHRDRVITLHLPSEPLLIHGDPRRLRQVAANLLENAVKYSPNGGEIELSAAPAGGDGATFSVQDHGIGIPATHLGNLFQRFYRVDTGPARDIGGTGLGLAICRRIVEEHGGRIEVVSTEGEGSTFTVTLPGTPAPVAG